MNVFRRISGLFLLPAVLLGSPLASHGASSVYIPGISSSINVGQYQGLYIVNDGANPNTQLDITVVAAILVNSSYAPQLGTNVNKVLNIANTGANGRRAGLVPAPNTFYSIYLIGKTDGSSTDTFLDSTIPTTTPVAPTLPAGYSYWVYLGDWFYTGGSNLVRGSQTNKVFTFVGFNFGNYFCCQAYYNTPSGLTNFPWLTGVVPVNRANKLYGTLSGTGSGWQQVFMAQDANGMNEYNFNWDEADSGNKWYTPFVYPLKMGSNGLYFYFQQSPGGSYFGTNDLGFDVTVTGWEYP